VLIPNDSEYFHRYIATTFACGNMNQKNELKLCLLRSRRRRCDGRSLTYIRILNLASVERQFVFEHDVERGATRKFCFGPAREQDRAKSR